MNELRMLDTYNEYAGSRRLNFLVNDVTMTETDENRTCVLRYTALKVSQ